MLISMFFAPAMSLWFSKGDSSAMLATAIARSSPDARPEPISATPLLVITVCTSAKSTLTVFSRVMTSAMPLAAVAEDVVGLVERLGQRQFAENLLYVLIVDQQQRVDALPQLVDTLISLLHPLRPLGLERNRHDRDSQNPQFAGRFRNDRSGSRTRAAAHSGRDEDHFRSLALVNLDDLVQTLQRRLPSFLGIVARSEPVLGRSAL